MAGRIVIIDGNALVHRAFHAIPTLTSPKGELVNAIYGVASMLLKVLPDLHPEYAVAAFDTSAPTFRHQEYGAYKGTRGPSPEGLHAQFVRVYQYLEAMAIPIFRVDGFEADDLLGTLARMSREQGIEVLVVTGDTDALQLVAPGVSVLTSRRGFSDTVLYDEAAVRERYGVEASQLVDLKALKGDTSDNIPGVPGIGEKTASKLVAEYGSLDGIYDHLEMLSPKMRQLLADNRDQAYFSRRLSQIVTDVPAVLDLEACRTGRYDRARLVELFWELGFRSLIDRIPKEDGSSREPVQPGSSVLGGQLPLFEEGATDLQVEQESPAAPRDDDAQGAGPVEAPAPAGYQLVATPEQLDALVAELKAAPIFAFDTETTGKIALQADLVGLSFAVRPGAAWYVPVGHFRRPRLDLGLLLPDGSTPPEEETEQLELEVVLSALRPLLEDESRPKAAHNGKYDMLALARYGVNVKGLTFDTMVAAYLLESLSLIHI